MDWLPRWLRVGLATWFGGWVLVITLLGFAEWPIRLVYLALWPPVLILTWRLVR